MLNTFKLIMIKKRGANINLVFLKNNTNQLLKKVFNCHIKPLFMFYFLIVILMNESSNAID